MRMEGCEGLGYGFWTEEKSRGTGGTKMQKVEKDGR
jgi:hypothetical protein